MKTFINGVLRLGVMALAALAVSPAPAAAGAESPATGAMLVFVGSNARTNGAGIYAWRMEADGSGLTSLGRVAATRNPSFQEVSPDHRFLYTVSEATPGGGKPTGAVSAYAIEAATGKLTLLNQQTSGGNGPCHVAVDREGKNVFVANYSSGSVESIPIQADGSLGTPTTFIQYTGKSVNPERQEGPHTHCVTLDAASRFAFVCEFGTDKVMAYRLDMGTGKLTANEPAFAAAKPGTGPRHMAFHPDGRQAYVIHELSSTIVHYGYDPAKGALTERQTISSLPPGFTGTSAAAEVAVHPSGKFVYGSNRGDDSITVFAVDGKTEDLTYVQRVSTEGKTPRFFALDPAGRLLFAGNQNSDSIIIFKVDAATGKLTPTGQALAVAAPMCVKFVPARAPDK